MYKGLFISLIILLCICLSAKQPDWITNVPESKYFYYYCGTGSSTSLDKSKEKAVGNVIFEIIKSGNITISGELEVLTSDFEENGKSHNSSEIVQDIMIEGESQNVYGLRNVGDYWEEKRSGYNYWVLIRVPKKASFASKPIYKSAKFAPIWRSALIPGWGQLYKQESVKGSFIMGSELALLSSSLFFAYKGKDFADKEENEIFDMDKRETYRNNKDLAYSISMVSIIGASVVYIYNLYDSFSNGGERKYTSLESENPFYIAFQSNQLSLAWNYRF